MTLIIDPRPNRTSQTNWMGMPPILPTKSSYPTPCLDEGVGTATDQNQGQSTAEILGSDYPRGFGPNIKRVSDACRHVGAVLSPPAFVRDTEL